MPSGHMRCRIVCINHIYICISVEYAATAASSPLKKKFDYPYFRYYWYFACVSASFSIVLSSASGSAVQWNSIMHSVATAQHKYWRIAVWGTMKGIHLAFQESPNRSLCYACAPATLRCRIYKHIHIRLWDGIHIIAAAAVASVSLFGERRTWL